MIEEESRMYLKQQFAELPGSAFGRCIITTAWVC